MVDLGLSLAWKRSELTPFPTNATPNPLGETMPNNNPSVQDLQRAVRTLSVCAELMVHAEDETALVQATCDALVRICGYRLAWVGFAEHESTARALRRPVRVVAHSGAASPYLDEAQITWDESPRGQGPTGTAIREQRSVTCQHINTDPKFAPWRAQALRQGYQSSLAAPIGDAAGVLGALNVYSAEPGAFDDEERELIEGIANTLSSGIRRLRAVADTVAQAELLQAVWDASPDYIALHAADGRIVEMSENIRTLLALDDAAGDAPSHGASSTSDHTERIVGAGPGGSEQAKRAVRAVLESGTPMTLEWTSRDAQGVEFPVEVRLQPLVRQVPGGARVMAVVRDLRPQRRAERERLDAERLAALSALSGGIAHDFNNMLTGIVCNLGLAREETDAEVRNLALREAEEVAMSAAKLTRELMSFAQAAPTDRRPVDLRALIETSARFSLRGSAVGLDLRLESGLWPVLGDETQLQTVVQNLVLNAIHAMAGAGTLRVDARNDSEWRGTTESESEGAVRVTVTDSGPGIPPDLLHRVFDPWVTTKPGGTGLGLASAHGIVTGHGGVLTAHNLPQGGACITMVLPRSTQAATAKSPTRDAMASGEGRRLLVMDDQAAIRSVVKRALSAAGYLVVTVADGSAAVQRFEQARATKDAFDAVLLDMTIPGGMGSAETLAALRVLEPGVVAVWMSGYTDHDTDGFDTFITKPFAATDLVRALAAALNQANP